MNDQQTFQIIACAGVAAIVAVIIDRSGLCFGFCLLLLLGAVGYHFYKKEKKP